MRELCSFFTSRGLPVENYNTFFFCLAIITLTSLHFPGNSLNPDFPLCMELMYTISSTPTRLLGTVPLDELLTICHLGLRKKCEQNFLVTFFIKITVHVLKSSLSGQVEKLLRFTLLVNMVQSRRNEFFFILPCSLD